MARAGVLIVDPDGSSHEFLFGFLAKELVEVAAASGKPETIALAEVRTASCAIIDLGLPDGNGLDLLSVIRESNPRCIPIILSGNVSPQAIVEAMREGAFDYRMKPVDFAAFQASLSRALHHHEVVRERDLLLEELSRERELLKTRVAETTADLQQHAVRIELVNARQKCLLQLNRMSEEASTEEVLFRSVFELLAQHVPLQCVAFATAHMQDYFIAAAPTERGEIVVVCAETNDRDRSRGTPVETGAMRAEMCAAVERHTGLAAHTWNACVFAQRSLGSAPCAVAFFVPDDYEVDADCDAFLSACASTVTSKWLDLRLFQYAAKHACVGSFALDLSHEMVQKLTAIRTAADVVLETGLTAEAAEGMSIIGENVENLGDQLQELRRISSRQKNTIETVDLAHLVDQALGLLASTIEHRGIEVHKEFLTSGECVLFNGTALARTFLDLISSAVRAVQDGHRIVLRLRNGKAKTVIFEINYDGLCPELPGVARRMTDQSVPSALGNHPKFIMAQRTIRTCGGTLSAEQEMDGQCAFRVVLPKDALSSSGELEDMGVYHDDNN